MTVIEDIVLVDGWQFQIDRNIPKILKSIGKENIIKYEWEKLIKEGKTADEIVNNVELLNRVLEKEEDIEYILKHTEDIMPVVVKSKIAMEYIGKRKDICDKIFGNAQENIESNTNWINAILNNSNAIAGLDSSNPITVPNMTGYTTPSGEAKASSEYQATSNYAWRAFNDSTEVDVSSWHSAEDQLLPQWIQYKFDKPVLVYKFYMQNRNQKTTWVNAPKDFVLLGSNDEKNWDTLGTYQNTNFQKLVGQIYMVQKIDKKYTYYRINVLTARRTDGTTATPYTAIGRIQFYCK